MINEKRVLPAVHLTSHQKGLLVRIFVAPNRTVRDEEISQSQNMVGARYLLMKLNLIHNQNGQIGLTKSGIQIMRDENIIDGSGNLTETGKQYIEKFNSSVKQQESFDLHRSILSKLEIQNLI